MSDRFAENVRGEETIKTLTVTKAILIHLQVVTKDFLVMFLLEPLHLS